MYFPLDLWKCLAADKGTLGPKGGRYLNYDNATRRLSNSGFLPLVIDGWIGTTLPQSDLLERVIEAVLDSGKTVTLAVKQGPTPTPVLPEDEPASYESGDDDSDDLADLLGDGPEV